MKNIKKNKKLVFVGLSGGVDSSVSAALLKEQGYDVVGVFIKVWQPDFIECTWRKERRDAMRVCAKLDIPFLTFDFEDVYKKEVADYMISEYKAGRVPNPDVMCNKNVKFGAFLKKALAMGADYVATGHYAQVVNPKENAYEKVWPSEVKENRGLLKKHFLLGSSVDPSKDQSYFLWTLKQDQLKHILFPIGHLKKTEVRKLAEKYDLHTSGKKDSQGICFLGKLNMKDFLKHYIKPKKGKVVLAPQTGNEKNEIIGEHDGAFLFTLGERHGFTIFKKTNHDTPYYVVGKDIKKNILIVGEQKVFRQSLAQRDWCEQRNSPAGEYSCLGERAFCVAIKETNWISEIPDPNKKYTCQIRYHGEFLPCRVIAENGNKKNQAQIIFENPQTTVSPGQSIVVYSGDICLGGGVVV